MGSPIYSCAGADKNNLPTSSLESILTNVLDHCTTAKRIANATGMLQLAKSKLKIGDSSGYQVLKREEKGKPITFDPEQPMKNTSKILNITPKHVMEANAILQPDIVIGLDWPIRKLKTDIQKKLEFYNKLQFNVPWAFESFAWKEALLPGAMYYQPIQAYNLDHLDIFLNRISGVRFHGISMPVRTLKPAELALFLVSFYQRGITRIHLLGTSSFPIIVLCAYAAWNLFELVSLDSTTWRFAAEKSSYISPFNLSRMDLRPSIYIPEDNINRCSCPFCNGQSFQSIQAITSRNDKLRLLREHNWLAISNLVADLYANGDTIPNLERELSFRCKTEKQVIELVRILSAVDVMKDWDISLLQSILAPSPTSRKRSCLTGQKTDSKKRP